MFLDGRLDFGRRLGIIFSGLLALLHTDLQGFQFGFHLLDLLFKLVDLFAEEIAGLDLGLFLGVELRCS